MAASERQKSNKDIDVLAIGGIDVDWLLKMPKLPSFDEKLPAEYLGKFPGGPVGNFACIARYLGLTVSSLCTVGDDADGRILLNDFEKFGVDTGYVHIDEMSITPFVIVIVDPTGEKAVIVPEVFDDVKLEIIPEAIQRSKYVYLMGKHLIAYPEINEVANQFGTKIMVDIEPSSSLSGDRIYQVLKQCSIASFNEQGFEAAFNKPFSVTAVQDLLRFGPELIVVTRGSKGAVAVSHLDTVEMPGYKVDVRDTTGAGDTFNAAFMYGTVHGYELEERVKFGNAAAAILIQSVGTRTQIPNFEMIQEFINLNK